MENLQEGTAKFLDGDDRLVPNAIETLVNAIQKCGCGLVLIKKMRQKLAEKVIQRYEDMYKQEWILCKLEKFIASSFVGIHLC